MSRFEVSPPTTSAELDAFAGIINVCFCIPLEHARWNHERIGASDVLLVRRAGEVVGGLYLLPMAQWFGGRSVSAMGIAAVGVAPEHRGTGAAKALMLAALAETRRRGFALSTLFPATYTLYRRCDYELAGGYHTIRLDLAGVPLGERSCTLRPIAVEDAPALEKLYRGLAAEHAGWLDRTPLLWRRITAPFEGPPLGQVVLADGAPVGYCYYRLRRHDAHHQTLQVVDLAATTPSAAARLLTFFADHRSLVKEVIWHGPLNDPLLLQLPEPSYRLTTEVNWMLAFADVEKALTQRGYPAGLAAELNLEVADGSAAPRRMVLALAGGAAEVRGGGRGEIVCAASALAPLYSGFMTPQQLVRAGRLAAPPEQLALLGAAFAGGPPSMVDIF